MATRHHRNPVREFENLLLEYARSEEAGRRSEIEKQLWEHYGAEHAVFVLDMSGFSVLSQRHGIVHFLSMVRRMQMTTRPIIDSYGGRMIKYEADNCYAVFREPLEAVNAAVAMQHAFTASNLLTADDLDIHIACGIDYGRLLVIGGEDCFGNPVNRAAKLGEDLAAPGEVLVTREAMERIPAAAGIRARALNVSISGIEIPAFAIEYRAGLSSA